MSIDALNHIDWDFPRATGTGDAIQSSHWFPGNYIGQIPSSLIQALSAPGDLIMDPFSGSGTTAVEALRLDRNVIASDRILACVMISAGKVALQNGALSKSLVERLLEQLVWRNLCATDAVGRRNEGASPELESWFAPSTLAQLRFLWQLVEKEIGLSKAALSLVFSDTLYACSSPGHATTASGNKRRHHWGWVADNVKPKQLVEHDAVAMFETRLLELAAANLMKRGGRAFVLCQDARTLAQPSSCVDMIVTSPPYVSMIDYTRANRLFYTWMGWNIDEQREQEIGARYKRQRRNAASDYVMQMKACWTEIHRVMKVGAYCALVIGESRKYPGTVDQTVADLESMMPRVWGPRHRVPSRRRVSDRASNPSVETLYVFQKS
ncbi:DNA methyltransferase [Hyphomicrobium sp.]|uniref:DNA methyltransferase n=1 Tax=Hyphomicrobium sp. TaxID=82 RepID=UPI000FAE2A52|nr:DNA methyltransferase [Hyphomicrobium sp.]RUP08602.1 MAG: hypothetical protein EKK38_12665 [Hyphomicrobium sp.]